MTATGEAVERGFFPGWIVVASAFVVLMTSAGLGFYGLAVYLEALTREQGFSTGSVSLATSLFFVVSGVAGRVIAPVMSRVDVRWVVGTGALVSGFALVLLGQVGEVWQVFGVYAVFGLGFALSGLLPATTVVTRWFVRRRSIALSVASTGLSVGGLTLTRLASALIGERGLADATPVLAVVYVALVGLALPFLWPDPVRRGLWPDGDPPAATVGGRSTFSGVAYDTAVHSHFFVFVTAAFVCFMGAQVGGIAQLAKLGAERVDRSTGALAVSLLALTSVVARLVGGVMATRVRLAGLTALLAAGQAVALVWLAFADSRQGLLTGAVLFGVTVGNLLMLQPLLMAEAFGVRDYPRIFATNQLVVTIGVALGPFVLGALHDASGYRLAYVVAAIISLVGTGLLLVAGSVERAKQELW